MMMIMMTMTMMVMMMELAKSLTIYIVYFASRTGRIYKEKKALMTVKKPHVGKKVSQHTVTGNIIQRGTSIQQPQPDLITIKFNSTHFKNNALIDLSL